MRKVEEIKKTGATFTPRPLADFLSSRIMAQLSSDQCLSVLDPACGDGELLLSISTQLAGMGYPFSLSGYDSNKRYLASAQARLQQVDSQHTTLINGDFLDAISLPDEQFSIGFDGVSQLHTNQLFDVIIANPPYVRTQVLGSENAQKLAQKFNLKGRVDLYYAFLIAMTNSLKDNGIIGVITSNRYLSTKSRESVRKFLTENYSIVELIDLGDTKLFDAAVLPALLIGRRKKNRHLSSPARFIKLYEELNGYQGACRSATTVYDILNTQDKGYFQVNEKRYKKTTGTLTFDTTNGWDMLSEAETEWTGRIDATASCRKFG
ncbi:MAG: N-6 DNA methylase [Rudanella sp.]|nr:N-6 DNA methylase [Rudanella sp.]